MPSLTITNRQTASGPRNVGFLGSITPGEEQQPHMILFGEEPSRFVVSFAPEDVDKVISICRKEQAPCTQIGVTGGDYLSLRLGKGDAGEVDLPVQQIADAWKNGFRKFAG